MDTHLLSQGKGGLWMLSHRALPRIQEGKSYEDLLSCETQCTWREVAKRKEGGREEIERKNCKERFDSSPTYDLKIYWLSNRTAEGKKKEKSLYDSKLIFRVHTSSFSRF